MYNFKQTVPFLTEKWDDKNSCIYLDQWFKIDYRMNVFFNHHTRIFYAVSHILQILSYNNYLNYQYFFIPSEQSFVPRKEDRWIYLYLYIYGHRYFWYNDMTLFDISKIIIHVTRLNTRFSPLKHKNISLGKTVRVSTKSENIIFLLHFPFFSSLYRVCIVYAVQI